MIRASIGKAVIDIAAPMKSAASPIETFSAKSAVSPWNAQRDERPERERGQDARPRDGHGAPRPAAQELDVEVEADEEHVEDETDLRDDVDDRHHRLREERPPAPAGAIQPEERRAEQDAGDHLPHDLRLADEAREVADEAAGEEDRRQRQEEDDRQLVVRHVGADSTRSRGKPAPHPSPPRAGGRSQAFRALDSGVAPLDSARPCPPRPVPLALLPPRRSPPLRRAGVASVLLLALGARTGDLDGELPLALWVLTVVGVDVAHVWSTGWRVYADPEEFRRRPALYLAIPAAAYAAGVVLYTAGPLVFWRVLAYLATFHFVRQQYGWVALYRRKSGENDESGASWERRLDVVTIYGATLAPLVFWHATLPKRFHWLLAGDYAADSRRGSAPRRSPRSASSSPSGSRKRCGASPRAAPSRWGKVLVVVTTALVWHLGIVVFDSDYVPLLALPQATHYLLDAWIWRGFKPDSLE